ncbi:MAG: xanthine dehydrogenase accessory protein XdhC [Thiothrix sp.]|nr:MAG: xanthine dehydrogenase accessory protein XdhC [Thiothrix sp.]
MLTVLDSIHGLPDWLRGMQAAIHEQQAFVLITLVATQGSVPREAGARLLVTEQGNIGTIGGGHLEWQASKRALSLFKQHQALSSLEVFTLGPQLDQCCGGVATLHYEYYPLGNVVWFDTLLQRWQQGLATSLTAYPQVWPNTGRTRVLSPTKSTASVELSELSSGEFCLVETFKPALSQLVLFGAGHVAQALVQVLLPLDWHIIWVDHRADLFPHALSEQQASVDCIVTSPTAYAAGYLPPASFCLIMTHEHSLDLELCAELLARSDLTYVGLIGSATKAGRFRKRLLEQGLTKQQLEKLVCPIGIRGIQSKQPAAIAIGVAAQLLQLREGRRAAAGEQIHES